MPRVRTTAQACHLSCLLLVLTAVAACGQKPTLPHLDSDAVILAFGDSLTYGTGATSAESYPAVLSELIRHEVINAGVPGETTAEGLLRLPGVLDDTQPDLVLLCLGGNDFLRRVSPSRTKQNLAQMIELLRGHRIPIVLVAVPEPGLMLSAHPMYRELAKQYDIPLEKSAIGDVLGERNLKSDSIHPNAAGYRQVAKALSELLTTAGAI
jgi:acyl-CoA thioesterase I